MSKWYFGTWTLFKESYWSGMSEKPYKIRKYQNSRAVHKVTNRIVLILSFIDNCI